MRAQDVLVALRLLPLKDACVKLQKLRDVLLKLLDWPKKELLLLQDALLKLKDVLQRELLLLKPVLLKLLHMKICLACLGHICA
jgi:hypothetical protein